MSYSTNSEILLYKALVIPHFEYCDLILCFLAAYSIIDTQKCNNGLRSILRCNLRTLVDDVTYRYVERDERQTKVTCCHTPINF